MEEETVARKYELRKVTESKELASLAARIKDDLPYCVTMHNSLLLSARGHSDCFNTEYFVPENYSESHIVISTKNTEPVETFIFCKEKETPLLVKIVQTATSLAYMREQLTNWAVPDYLLEPLSEVLQTDSCKSMDNILLKVFTYVSEQNHPLRCPTGMKLCYLTNAGIKQMIEKGHFKPSFEDMCAFATKTPAIGVYLDPAVKEETLIDLNTLKTADAEEVPIASVATHPYGSLGSLMTQEVHRRRGLGSLMTEIIGRLQKADGYIPHGFVEFDNPASLTMFGRLLGWKQTHCSRLVLKGHATESDSSVRETQD